MPFLRFELGDLAMRGRDLCTCGAPFPTLFGIKGRMIDIFRMPDGSDLHPWRLLDAAWPHLGWISEYRFVQETTSRVVMYLTTRRRPTDTELRDLAEKSEKVLGPDVEFVCSLVDQMERDPSGKTRPFRSLVHSTYE